MSEVVPTTEAKTNTDATVITQPTTETKTAVETQAAKTETVTTEVKPPVVPEKYDFKLPEGSPLTQAHMDRAAVYAKTLGLTQEKAQELVTRDSEMVKEFVSGQEQEFKRTTEQWRTDVENDKELGGANYKETVALASRAFEQYATPEFKKVLDETGFGNHPELVRTFSKIGKAMDSGRLILGGNAQGTKSIEEIMYPTKQ